MKKLPGLIVSTAMFTINLIAPAGSANIDTTNPPLTTVDRVDLHRYLGLWYEIAKIPNTFQKKCAGGTTAFYTLRSDGKIDVTNRCTGGKGQAYQANGIARIIDAQSNARLQVSFVRILGISFFWGDYWIIGLDDDYEWAIVGHPKRKYGWILSRTPRLSESTFKRIFAILGEKGYDPAAFEMTLQPEKE
ncbi:MAG: lipocalin family protein [bacterium]|nr:lipocalin family protein [bacterium]